MQLFAFDPVKKLATFEQIEADTETTTLQLKPAASIKGQVRDDAGNPRRNVAINASSNALGQVHLTTQTDAAGNFEFPAVTLKMNWYVTVLTEGNSQSKDINVQEAKDYPLEAFLIPSK